MKKIKFYETDAFKKDFKRLSKKFKTLKEDLEVAKTNAIKLFHLHNVDSQSVVVVPGYEHETIKIFKLRKFSCKSLKGRGSNSGIRIIYSYRSVEQLVDLIEIYFKGQKEREDHDRIKAYLKS